MQENKGGYIRADAAATYLGVAVTTLYKMCQRREIPFFAVNSRVYRFTYEDLDAYIAARRVALSAGAFEMADAVLERMDARRCGT